MAICHAIGADGRITLGPHGPVRIEGHTPGEIAQQLGQVVGCRTEDVTVQVAGEYNSRHVILCGQVTGQQRVHSYRGQETVLDLLQRTGGITHGAAP